MFLTSIGAAVVFVSYHLLTADRVRVRIGTEQMMWMGKNEPKTHSLFFFSKERESATSPLIPTDPATHTSITVITL